MDCKDVRPLADAYLSEQLLVETTHAVVTHLERCPTCWTEFEAQRRLRAATRSAFEGAPDLRVRPEFLATLTTRLRAVSEASSATPPWRSWLALAAGVVLAAGLGVGGVVWIASGALSALGQLAAGDHQNCAIKFRLDERPITLAEAATKYDVAFGRLNAVQPAVPALSAGSIRVLERHACVYNGQRFAHIVLSYKDTAVSILVAAEGASGNGWWRAIAARELPPAGGFNLASFRSTGHMVFVVSSLNSADVEEVARAMTGPVTEALAGI
jgi:anti-sigma factor RsiW